MRLRVHHRTDYHYSEPVLDNINELRLRPLDTRWQRCESSVISVLPASRLRHYEDLHYNRVHYFELTEAHSKLRIESRAVVVTKLKVDFQQLPYGFSHADLGSCRQLEECHPFLQGSEYVELNPEVWRQALDIKDDSEDVLQTAYAIMEHIFNEFDYRSGSTTVATHANEVIAQKFGVCQDFAHAMVAFCRSIGIPARYVSGYFFDATRDHSLRGSEATHAWVEVYIDGHGWIGLDPTNRKIVDETYIVIATGRDYADVAPVRGTFLGAARSALDVSVTVTRLES